MARPRSTSAVISRTSLSKNQDRIFAELILEYFCRPIRVPSESPRSLTAIFYLGGEAERGHEAEPASVHAGEAKRCGSAVVEGGCGGVGAEVGWQAGDDCVDKSNVNQMVWRVQLETAAFKSEGVVNLENKRWKGVGIDQWAGTVGVVRNHWPV